MLKLNIKQTIKQNMRTVLVNISILAAIGMVIYLSDTGCLFKYTIGVPCPGCGMTRSWISFFMGDIKGALNWHPLFWLVPILMAAAIMPRGMVFKNKIVTRSFWIILITIVLGVYLIRMIKLFPDTAPMNYNEQSVLYKQLLKTQR